MNDMQSQNRMYSNLPNLIIGFHGCDKSVADAIINGTFDLKVSRNSYDWLGNGMYFWEQNLDRALEWAVNGAKNPHSSITTPAVVGAIIDLGYCLNLMDNRSAKLLQDVYKILESESIIYNKKLPQNKNIRNNNDLLLRYLDCSVIERLDEVRRSTGQQPFDSVRGLFIEGNEIYPTSGFREKTHIQIAVRNPNCIKGFFHPRQINPDWNVP